MEDIKESYDRLIKSKEFKKQGYLCGIFMMSELENIDDQDWEIDFYDKKSGKITSYSTGNDIRTLSKEKPFAEDKEAIEEINLEDVKISYEKAIEIGKNALERRNEEATKIIVILQKIKDTIWNITFITKKLNILNIKMDAVKGNILKEEIVSLLSFKKK